ncbi:MAG: helix-turn-helix domain-containing protein [Planctomycetes bacterium]|nr:helix-turn-helix domain-containing protein [Planctomycetota bacterium]
MSTESSLLTPREAAEILRLSERHVRRLVAAGTLKAIKLSDRKTLIPRPEVERLAGIEVESKLARLERVAERLERLALRLEDLADRQP